MEVGERKPFFQFLIRFAAVESSMTTWKFKHALNICPKGKGDNHLQTINFVIPCSYVFCLVSLVEQAWICLLHPWNLIEQVDGTPNIHAWRRGIAGLMVNTGEGTHLQRVILGKSDYQDFIAFDVIYIQERTPIKLVLPLLLGRGSYQSIPSRL